MEYDFSGIPTDTLRKAVKKEFNDYICVSINCKGHNCPFYEFANCDTNEEFGTMFEKELYKRDHPYTAEDINKLITEEAVEEYKDITLDWTVKEIMELDLDRVEFFSVQNDRWEKTLCCHKQIIMLMEHNSKYRYRLIEEPIRITKKLNDLMFEKNLTGAVYNNKVMIRFEGSKVEIIGEEK